MASLHWRKRTRANKIVTSLCICSRVSLSSAFRVTPVFHYILVSGQAVNVRANVRIVCHDFASPVGSSDSASTFTPARAALPQWLLLQPQLLNATTPCVRSIPTALDELDESLW